MACLIVVAAGFGCRPDLPGRNCSAPEDCFSTEACVSGTCVDRDRLQTPDPPEPDAAEAEPDAAQAQPDAGADGALVMADGAVADDAVVDGGADAPAPDAAAVIPDAAPDAAPDVAPDASPDAADAAPDASADGAF